jgi:hypothetical protein
MRHFKAVVASAYVALALVGIGCGEDPAEQSGGLGMATGGAPVAGTSGIGGNAGTSGVGSVAHANAMPCDVATVVQTHCGTCHGATTQFGAPVSLTTLADFQRDYPVATTTQLAGRTMKMYELARIRVLREMGTLPMPQGAPLAANDLTMLSTWLGNGAPAGIACASTGGTGGVAGDVATTSGGVGGVAVTGGVGGEGGTVAPEGPPQIDDQCVTPGAFDPLTPKYPQETCYDFLVHGRSGVDDTSKFRVPTSESYNQFYYAIPWPAGSVATRFGQDFDNTQVLHHWLAFAQTLSSAPGTVEPNVTGTTLFTDAELIAGWAVGGCTTTFPEDVGVALPDIGGIMIQWHHYNNTGLPAEDGSKVQICVVPENTRPHKAGLTFLGTELLSVPPGQMGQASGTCFNDSQGPITIIGFTPHMHEIGIHMKSVVTRAMTNVEETVFDLPFQFDYQTNYMLKPTVVLQPGDAITSTCTWQNQGPGSVGFGQSTKQEMCYQFALSYPYRELNNGVISLIGATNTCW